MDNYPCLSYVTNLVITKSPFMWETNPTLLQFITSPISGFLYEAVYTQHQFNGILASQLKQRTIIQNCLTKNQNKCIEQKEEG